MGCHPGYPVKLAATDTDPVEAAPVASACTDPINEQRGCITAAGHLTVDNFVAVYEIRTVDNRFGDLHHDNRIVRLSRLIDG